ncbi:hypothetical protein [Desulfonatronum parangueonense]
MGFPPSATAYHPYVLAMKEYLERNIHEYNQSSLKYYFEHVQPRTAAEFAGVSENDHDSKLHWKEAVELDFPWLATPGPQVKSRRFEFMQRDAVQFGKQLTGEDGFNFFGPLSSAKADLEMRRIVLIIGSINKTGYRVSSIKNHLLGYLLKDDNSYVALPWGGQHRLAALAALGFTHVPMLFHRNRFTDRTSVNSWPAVASGDFTPEHALHLFDRIIEGRQPRHVEKVWPDVITTKLSKIRKKL